MLWSSWRPIILLTVILVPHCGSTKARLNLHYSTIFVWHSPEAVMTKSPHSTPVDYCFPFPRNISILVPTSGYCAAQIMVPCKICTATIHWLSSNQNKFFFWQPEYLLCTWLILHISIINYNFELNAIVTIQGNRSRLSQLLSAIMANPLIFFVKLLKFQIHSFIIHWASTINIYIYIYTCISYTW